jgi:hypothetical protein
MDTGPPDKQAGQSRLLGAIERVLGRTMGVSLPFRSWLDSREPYQAVLSWLVLYAVLWLAVAELAVAPGSSRPRLVSLIAWCACYFAGALYLARSTTRRLLDTIANDILPHASPDYEERVAAELDRRFGPASLVLLPLLAAAASVVAAWWAVGRDTGRAVAFSGPPDAELILFSVSAFIYFYAAAVAVVAARFYAAFASNLEAEHASFYVMGAADTPLVKGLSKLGTQVLTFWALVFLLILSSMLLAFAPPETYELTGDSRFLFLLVPIAGFFSLGLGCLLYLQTEARIRATLQRFVNAQAAMLQQRSNALIDPGAGRVPEDAEALRRLTEWQDRILAGGRYGSRAGASISIALPLLLPLLTLALKLFER